MITQLALTLTLGAAGLGAVPTAAAAAETCHGQPATIVGTPGVDLEGTDGPDVVVTNGAGVTVTGAGDDLVCVTGGAGLDTAEAVVGEGDDVVDATASEARRSFAALDVGDDVFTGGDGSDHVIANDPWDEVPAQGSDVVSTGGGEDLVESGGSFTRPDRDDIDLGPGEDWMWLQGVVSADYAIRGGEGRDLIEFGRTALRRPLVIDNARGVAVDSARPVMAWSGMERFRLSPIGRSEAPAFIGGDGPERVWTAVPLSSVELGGGNDVLNLAHQDYPVRASYDGGAGRDFFILLANDSGQARRLDLDLRRGTMLFDPEKGDRVRSRIRAFERYRLSSDRLDVRGTTSPDHIEWLGCRGVVDGGPGADVIERFWNADRGCGYLDQESEQVVRGGGGSDRLVGTFAPDILIGGPGDDVADGRGGKRDRCVAETERNCEL